MGVSQADARYSSQAAWMDAVRQRVKHVFVLMLENRSFDHMFGQSGIPGIRVATNSSINLYEGQAYPFQGDAPEAMPTDPGHEFLDVVEQLNGSAHAYQPRQPYPPINNSGFISNYASTTSEGPVPALSDIANIMKGVNTKSLSPALFTLASEFALCDNWFASLPGPTWPNRYFLHGASSSGLDDSPTSTEVDVWESLQGFTYSNGSIFDALRLQGHQFRLYHDEAGPLLGQIPQVASIKGVSLMDIGSLDHFEQDLKGDYPYDYTFIEPSYGDVANETFQGGSSQHPKDGLAAGDRLIARVYNSIRSQKAIWEKSLLVITYDEHGGFFDHFPPGPVVPPGDQPTVSLNRHGFDFSNYGVRVPAVVVSPWIQPQVDPRVYDHTSVLATIECLLDMPALTNRDRLATDLLHLVSNQCRQNCPKGL